MLWWFSQKKGILPFKKNYITTITSTCYSVKDYVPNATSGRYFLTQRQDNTTIFFFKKNKIQSVVKHLHYSLHKLKITPLAYNFLHIIPQVVWKSKRKRTCLRRLRQRLAEVFYKMTTWVTVFYRFDCSLIFNKFRANYTIWLIKSLEKFHWMRFVTYKQKICYLWAFLFLNVYVDFNSTDSFTEITVGKIRQTLGQFHLQTLFLLRFFPLLQRFLITSKFQKIPNCARISP